MNLYLRMLLVLLKAAAAKKITPLTPSTITFRTLPFDCDINGHLTNSRYLSFMDLGRTYYVGQLKMIGKLFKKKWMPVVASSEITFIRQVKPLQKVTLMTQLLTWDEKYQYFYQRFSTNQQIVATALVKTAAHAKDGTVSMDKILQLYGEKLTPPPIPKTIKIFRELTANKRQLHG